MDALTETDPPTKAPTARPSTATPWLAGRPRLAGHAVDADAVRRLLDERGVTAGLAALDGPFALALTLADGSRVLAVDRFAAETLCWRVVDGRLHHAARADTLARLAPRADIDPQALFDYLHFHAIPSPATAFRGVYRLPPAHCLWVRPGDAREPEPACYWTPRFAPQPATDLPALKQEFRRLMQQAVARELDGSTPACFLSGGTDSSTVAGLIRDVTGQGALGFSIGFEAEGYDEMAYARIAAGHFGVRHHEHYVTPAELVDGIPRAAAFHDQPFGNSSVLPAWLCAQQARAQGVTRLLAGDGGDELFGGNARYGKQKVFGWYGRVPGVLRRGLLEPLLLRTPLGGLPLARKGRSYIEQARVPMPDRFDLYNLLWRVGLDEVLEPDWLAQVDRNAPARQQRAVWAATVADDELDCQLAFDWRYTLAESDLPKVRLATAQAGVGVGFPLLDGELLDFSLKLPPALKLRGQQLRWFFKEALRGYLPDAIITKPKHGFGLPFGVWATRHAPLAALARDSLESLARRGMVRGTLVQRLVAELLPAHPGYYGELVWILMMMEQWLRAHGDARSESA